MKTFVTLLSSQVLLDATTAAQQVDPTDIPKLLQLLGQIAVAIIGVIAIFKKKKD